MQANPAIKVQHHLTDFDKIKGHMMSKVISPVHIGLEICKPVKDTPIVNLADKLILGALDQTFGIYATEPAFI